MLGACAQAHLCQLSRTIRGPVQRVIMKNDARAVTRQLNVRFEVRTAMLKRAIECRHGVFGVVRPEAAMRNKHET